MRAGRLTLLLAPVMLVSGALSCGTRLPDSAFRQPTASPSPAPVTKTLVIGTIASVTNPFDAEAFTGPLYGLRAFVDEVNRHGGINGRQVVLRVCDDGGSGTQNVVCVHRLLDQDHVFALVSSATLSYAGAGIVNKAGVPDVGAQPIDIAYTKYPHLWDVNGESYPRDGTIGWDGWLHGGTEVYRFFKTQFPGTPLRAGVVYYNQAASKRFGNAISRGLQREGYQVVPAEVNFALPDYNSVAIKFRHEHVRYVYDAIDRAGNERLCRAMDDNEFVPVAKITTTQGWTGGIGTDYAKSPRCRNVIYATGGSRSYDDTAHPAVRAFRQAMGRLDLDKPGSMSEWALEGWAGAQWFADAAESCGQSLTRECVERYLQRSEPYTGHGLLLPRSFTVGDGSLAPHLSCVNVVRWQDDANNGNGGWVDQVPDMYKNCFVVPSIAYRP